MNSAKNSLFFPLNLSFTFDSCKNHKLSSQSSGKFWFSFCISFGRMKDFSVCFWSRFHCHPLELPLWINCTIFGWQKKHLTFILQNGINAACLTITTMKKYCCDGSYVLLKIHRQLTKLNQWTTKNSMWPQTIT